MIKRTAVWLAACVVLAATMDVADAAWAYIRGATELVIDGTAGHTQGDNPIATWTATDDLSIGNVNWVADGPDSWDGRLRVESGGSATCNLIYMCNGGDKANGRIIVDGTGTMTANGRVYLAMNSHPGKYRIPYDPVRSLSPPCLIEITNGGKFYANNSGNTQVGNGQSGAYGPSWGMVTVDGNGSEFVGPGGIVIGGAGCGEVTITNQGKMTVGISYVGANSSPTYEIEGILNISGAGSEYTAGQLNMGGSYSKSYVTVTDGGKVTTSYMQIATTAGGGSAESGDCEVLVTGSDSLVDVTHSGGYSIFIGGGLSGVKDNALVTLEEGGKIEATHLITVYNTATLAFGVGSGSTIATDGAATIDNGAAIGVKLDSGFSPASGTPYDLVTAAGGITVTPGALLLDQSAMPAGASASLSATATALQVTFTAPPSGTTIVVR